MNIQALIQQIKKTVRSDELENGGYCRYLSENGHTERKTGNNEYGCADAANILYTVGAFEREPARRQELVSAIRGFQHSDGLFDEGSHHPIHCTAHCIAALELFDAGALIPLSGFSQYKTKEGLRALLESLDWVGNPWSAAHQGAGIYAAMVLSGEVAPDWQDFYFSWLTESADPTYGIGLKGAIAVGEKPAYHHLNGWFHYLFNFAFAHRKLPYARQATDTCLQLYRNDRLGDNFTCSVGFAQIDWVYTLNRCSRQEGYRVDEATAAIRDFAEKYIPYLMTLNHESSDKWNDLHLLFGSVCALAELQNALPGEIESDYPLKLVLDRRPFI